MNELRQQIATIAKYARATLSAGRFAHTARVAARAGFLCGFVGCSEPDFWRVQLAAWLHDLTKEYSPAEHESLFARNGTCCPDRTNYTLYHGLAASILATELLDSVDPDILQAVQEHTLGKLQMCRISQILFLADATEPCRDADWRQTLDAVLQAEGLEAAVRRCQLMKDQLFSMSCYQNDKPNPQQ